MQWCQRLEADYGMDLWVWQSLDGPSFRLSPNFVSVTPSMGVLFPILRRGKVSTLWSLSNIYKELKKVDSRKSNNPIKKRGSELNKEFSHEEYRMAEKHLKKCSTSLISREMQIKTTLRFHLTPVRMAKIKNSGDSRCWRACGERGTLLHCWWDLYNHSGNQSGGSSENWT